MVRGRKRPDLPPAIGHHSRVHPSTKNSVQVAVPDGYVAFAEAARRLGVVHGTLLYRIGRGLIKTETIMVPATVISDMTIQNILDEKELRDDAIEDKYARRD